MESVFCAGGIHGLRASVCGKGNGVSFDNRLIARGLMHCVLSMDVLRRSWTNQWLEHWNWNPRDLVSLPDSVARVSFGTSFNRSWPQFSLVILMKLIYILFLIFFNFNILFWRQKVKILSVIKSVITHYCSQTFWKCLPRREIEKNPQA